MTRDRVFLMLSIAKCLSMRPVFFGILLLGCALGTASAAKKNEKTLATPEGKPVRTVYVDAGSVVMANAATAQLSQDTCLTTVSDPKQADAVLEVGIALPSVGGDSGGGPDVFGSKPRTQSLGNAHSKPKRSASVTCSDSKGESGGCTTPYSAQGGELPVQPAADWTEGMGPSYTVSLASPGNRSQDLWDPDGRRKRSSWSNQLRQAAGCPVCPGERFNPRHDKMTYRQWMQAKCPGVPIASASQ